MEFYDLDVTIFLEYKFLRHGHIDYRMNWEAELEGTLNTELGGPTNIIK